MSRKYLTVFATLCTTLTLAHSPAFAQDTPTFSDDFNSPESLSSWNVMDKNNYASSHTSYLPENVHVDNGNLVIDSHRHCTDTADEPLTKDSIHEDPCPSGKHTRYSSGRLNTLDKVDGSQDFTVEFRAKISGDRKVGTRPALWLLRQDASYCQKVDWDATGEFDVLEWYGHRPNQSFSTSHVSCQGSGSGSSRKTGTKAVSQNTSVDNMLNEWHTWRMDFDRENKRATYSIDGKVINTTHFINTFTGKKTNFRDDHVDFTKNFDLSNDQLSQIFDHKFQIILNDWVEAKGPNVPKDSQKFPSVQFLIDSVKVYQGNRQSSPVGDTPQPANDAPKELPKDPGGSSLSSTTGGSSISPHEKEDTTPLVGSSSAGSDNISSPSSPLVSGSEEPQELNSPSYPQASTMPSEEATEGSEEPSSATPSQQLKGDSHPHSTPVIVGETPENSPAGVGVLAEASSTGQGSQSANSNSRVKSKEHKNNNPLSLLPMLGKNSPAVKESSTTKESTVTPGAVVATGGQVDYSFLDKIKAFFF